jgi:hypothetical protein
MKFTCSLLLQSQCFSYGGNNGERNCLGLKAMYVTAKLTIFPWLSSQEEHPLSLPFIYTVHEKQRNKQAGERQLDLCLAITYMDDWHWLTRVIMWDSDCNNNSIPVIFTIKFHPSSHERYLWFWMSEHRINCRIWGFHSGGYEEYHLLGYDAV